MNETLLECLGEHQNEIIWVAIPGGVLSGSLLLAENGIVTLHEAIYYTGSTRLGVDAADVLIDRISAYGLGAPVIAQRD